MPHTKRYEQMGLSAFVNDEERRNQVEIQKHVKLIN
jgi:hypothetical protein